MRFRSTMIENTPAVVPGFVAPPASGCLSKQTRTVHSIRVRLESGSIVAVGREIGETGTDSAMIGICDIGAFDSAFGRDSEDLQEELEEKTQRGGFGLITFRKHKGAPMAFVPAGHLP